MSVHIDCDGVVIVPPSSTITSSNSTTCVLETDWFFIQPMIELDEDPLLTYLELAAKINRVDQMYSDTANGPKWPLSSFASSTNTETYTQSYTASSTSTPLVETNSVPVVPTPPSISTSPIPVTVPLSTHTETSLVVNRVPAGWCSWYHFFEKVCRLY